MIISDRVKDQYIARLDELIHVGSEMPLQKHSKLTSMNVLSGERKYRQYDLAKWSEFIEWRTSCIAVLDQIVPKNSLLRKTVDIFDTLGNSPTKVDFGIAFLRSVRTELINGSLDALILQLESEILADYLGQASRIFKGSTKEPTHVAAAVLAGASLEKSLKKLCENLNPPETITNKKRNMSMEMRHPFEKIKLPCSGFRAY